MFMWEDDVIGSRYQDYVSQAHAVKVISIIISCVFIVAGIVCSILLDTFMFLAFCGIPIGVFAILAYCAHLDEKYFTKLEEQWKKLLT